LVAAEVHVSGDPPAEFGAHTEAAVREFQRRRGLRIDGVCGPQTWSALVEAGYRLGDRLMYRRTPMLRGDDVAELQQRLGALGFDTGRVDGIFGDDTALALSDFQRNVGLTADGILGRSTLDELYRIQARSQGPELVSDVRERETLRRGPRTLHGRRIALGEQGGLGAAVATIARALAGAGADVVDLHHPDGSRQAADANAVAAGVYLGLRLDPTASGCASSYYGGSRYESPGGRRLAELVQETVPAQLFVPDRGAHRMSIPVLRETRMPAVVCELGPPTMLVERSHDVARAVREALDTWVRAAWD
jgi:N-acetylmuramoyl-L-alanine amidase